MTKKVKVLIVDDSALVRQVLQQGLSRDPGLEIVGTAGDPFQARDKIVELNPDVLTLDVEMPRMDGVEFLRRLMPQHPIPVVMVSALTEKGKKTTMDALEAGAVDFVTKPSSSVQEGLEKLITQLATKIKIASTANVSHWKNRRPLPSAVRPAADVKQNRALAESTDKVVVIGASTGGTEAIRQILASLPASAPGIVVVQHMPPGFTRMLAERLNQQCEMLVKEAANGDRIMTGRVLIAPGAQHIRIKRRGGIYEVLCRAGTRICGHCPSVEVLMKSAAEEVGANALGVLLTGMGKDGANALLAMRKAGARTIGQDEATCVVYGMPKVARELGAVEFELPLERIAAKVVDLTGT